MAVHAPTNWPQAVEDVEITTPYRSVWFNAGGSLDYTDKDDVRSTVGVTFGVNNHRIKIVHSGAGTTVDVHLLPRIGLAGGPF